MSEFFGWERSVVTNHINNVFREGELDKQSNVHIMHIANSDKPVAFYNLDVIISVGYRVLERGQPQRVLALLRLHADLIARDKASLDIFWLKDDSLEDSDNLPEPGILAAEIVTDLEAALEQFRLIAEDLGEVDMDSEEDN